MPLGDQEPEKRKIRLGSLDSTHEIEPEREEMARTPVIGVDDSVARPGPGVRTRKRVLKALTAKTLARSLDLLHVAAAHVTSCTRFVSGDDRQLAVAKASGLEVVDINRGVRRSTSQTRHVLRNFAIT